MAKRKSAAVNLYCLRGPQVEPQAGYWTDAPCPVPCVVRAEEVVPEMQPYPRNGGDEIAELLELQDLRDDPAAIAEPNPARRRCPPSRFLQLRPPALTTVYCLQREQPPLRRLSEQCTLDDPPVITTGRELARMFEAETPGLLHRHALNCLMAEADWSPPRQALAWMALDVTIYSALVAAWHEKWLLEKGKFSYRPRPIELSAARRLEVLFDREVASDGCRDGLLRDRPIPSPGTPRHPSYPSGHSTYSAAASFLLAWFFPAAQTELEYLADNIGIARLWAGIHYRSDHVEGQNVGTAVARRVILQIMANGIPLVPEPVLDSPSAPCGSTFVRRLSELRQEFRERCEAGDESSPEQFAARFPDGGRPADMNADTRRARSPQRGAR
jgi:hypothetical protein